jgi:putative multicomponent Na+:H+ antiporter subunit B
MSDWIIMAVVALLPVGALLTVLQRNPYHALVARGIFGAIAALVYATLGAPDVALTEILMGTLLTIILYAIAVRSSLVLRLGWISPAQHENSSTADYPFPIEVIRNCSQSHYLRLELVAFDNTAKLLNALREGKISAACGEGPLPGMPFSEKTDQWLLFDATDSLKATFSVGLKNHPMAVFKLSELKQA